MAAPRREWLKLIVESVAATTGMTTAGEAMPYSPAVMEAMANSGKAMH